MRFFKLFEKLPLRTTTLRNRFVIPAMHLNFAEGGFVNEQLVEFYRRRAQGGAGLIIVGGVSVEKRGRGVPMMIAIEDDKFIPGLKQLTDAVHNEGAKIVAQLYHAGAYAFSRLIGEKAISSSAVYSKFTHETPRELSTEEVEELIQLFADAAERAYKAGFDGIELLSSAGYLIDQFLSPIKNKRTDKYGGETLEERLTFPLELIETVKKRVGDKILIGIRLSGDDFVPQSNTYHEKKIVARAYAKAGVDYINVTGGWHETRVPQIPMNVPRGAFSYLAKEIKEVTREYNVPVFSSNRINDPILGEQLLQDGYADAICFGRAMIADPDFVKKTKEGKVREIRKCIACNQGCFDGIFKLQPIKCTVNPYAGQELKYASPPSAPQRYTIVVVGAGPAGLEAAITAARFGHKVVIFEEKPFIGGQLNVAYIPPGREEIKSIIEWYSFMLKKYTNITLHLSTPATPENILKEDPDYVFFSTGVYFNIPPIPGIDGRQGCNICFADEALAGDYPLGKKVVVVGGAATGVETAIWAAKRGAMDPYVAHFLSFYKALPAQEAMERTFKGTHEVYLLELLPRLASSVGKSTRWVFLQELEMLGVKTLTNVHIEEFRNNAVHFTVKDGEKEEKSIIDNVDTFILATGVKPNRDLYNKFKAYLKEHPSSKKIGMKLIGDAKKVGTILDAIHAGFKAIYKLGEFNPS